MEINIDFEEFKHQFYLNNCNKIPFSVDNDPNILATLSSTLSQDAYELYLYPKAKDKSVDYVIKNYTKYFKPINNTTKLRVLY